MKHGIRLIAAAALLCSAIVAAQSPPALPSLPSGPLAYGLISAQFAPDGTFTLGGGGWPKLSGTWKAAKGEVEFVLTTPPNGCAEPGKFRYRIEGKDGQQVRFELVADTCMPRRMMLMDSVWLPVGEKPVVPPRRLVKTSTSSRPWPDR